MKLETFFEKFDLFADAPDAAARMREVIWQLAVQGKLVQQNPTDEHASVLLERIRKTKISLLKNRRGSRIEKESNENEELYPYSIPTGWIWTQLGSVQIFTNGYAFKSDDYRDTGVGIIRMGELGANGDIDETNMKYVSPEIANSISETFVVNPGDLLMGMSGSIGKLAINRSSKTYLLNQRVGRLEPIIIEKAYLYSFLKTAEQHYLQISFGMAIKNLSTKQIIETPFPLPPLAEQKRIVAKVDELMALCDQLEAQQQQQETRHAALVQASLARFTQAPTPTNLQFLFHPSYTVSPADLRKTILTLAVQGKLVPQDPKDKRASLFPTDESPFNIPANWQWRPLGTLGLCRTGKTPPTNDPTNYGSGFPFIGPGQITQNGSFTPSEKTITQTGLSNSTEAKANDILMVCIGGSIGKAAICLETIGFNQQINSIRLADDLPTFVYLALTSSYFQEQVITRASGSATPIINKGKWAQILIPLPPLAEQRRIVAKVDKLMALVDDLESQLAASRTVAHNLMAALVQELTTSP
jgi:type I restriction enzyme S subunit